MEISEELAEIIGIHLGDGCISKTTKYQEYAINGDITEEREYYDNHVLPIYNSNIFKPILGKEIIAKNYEKNGTYGIYVFNEKIVSFFEQLGIKSGVKLDHEIPDCILKNKRLWKFFLRGIFDTDGSIYFNKNYSVKIENRKHNRPRIKLGMTSKKIIKAVRFMLEELGYNIYQKPSYKGKKDKNAVHSIMIQRKKDIERFIKEIGFKSSKHLTKWQIYKIKGYCPPNTKLKERYQIINETKVF